MTETPSKRNFTKLGWIAAAVVFAAIVVYFLTREHYTNDMLTGIEETLVKHELNWKGRGRDYAQYEVKFHGSDDSTFSAMYRIPAATDPVPGLVVLHMSGDSSVLELLDETGNASQCAILCIDASQYFARDGEGELRPDNKYLGRAVIASLKATDLSLDFLSGHRIVDTTAIYLLAVGEANLIGFPAAALQGDRLAGMGCIHPEFLFEFRGDDDDFASPIYWVKRIQPSRALMVNGESRDSKQLSQLAAELPGKSGQVMSPAKDVNEAFVGGVRAAIDWVMLERPAARPDTTRPTPPAGDSKQVITVKR